ncbi:MAG: TMEM175 family protein [Streptosporangiaceae bacterium]
MADGTGDTGDTGEADSSGQPAGRGWLRVRSRAAIGPGVHGAPDPIARAGHMEYDRILFFTDAVFAIAITLLIVDLPVQVERLNGTLNSADQLKKDLPGILGFGISFAVIALFWLAHHSTFRYIKAIDRPLMLLNLLFLGVIAFLPYPTELLSASSNSQAPATVFYAACAGSAGLLETLAWWYAMRAGLIEGLDESSQWLFLLRAARVPLVFGISIAIAQVSPRGATYFWLALAVSGWIVNRYYDRRTGGAAPARAV